MRTESAEDNATNFVVLLRVYFTFTNTFLVQQYTHDEVACSCNAQCLLVEVDRR